MPIYHGVAKITANRRFKVRADDPDDLWSQVDEVIGEDETLLDVITEGIEEERCTLE